MLDEREVIVTISVEFYNPVQTHKNEYKTIIPYYMIQEVQTMVARMAKTVDGMEPEKHALE